MPIFSLRAVVAVASLSVVAAGTASGQGRAPSGQPAPAASGLPAAAPAADAPRRDRNRLIREDLAVRTEADLLTLLQGFRPAWLRVRGRGSINRPEQVWVYRDGIRLGGVQTLRQIQTTQVREIQFMEGPQATQRFGIDHGSGAILVTSL
jgi:hypothetical protein